MQSHNLPSANYRLRWWYGVLILILAVIICRLFYLQVIRHDYYRDKALSTQLKEYSIPAQRGMIKAYEAGAVVPLVLNEKLYTLYADPTFVKNHDAAAARLSIITEKPAEMLIPLLKTEGTRYVVLAKRLSEEQMKRVAALKLPGVGTQAQNYRTYPQGSLAAQLLGFVNNDGRGTYGIEEALNQKLDGTPGRLKAVTDARGVPLAASDDNIQISPVAGEDVVLTIDLAMQKQAEDILKKGLERARSNSGSVVIMNPATGAIKAMANLPTYEPAQYFNVKDAQVFNNSAVSSPLEVGSIMKPLTASAALDLGVVNANSSYYDPFKWKVDGYTITNIEEAGGAGPRTVADILNQSLNTGATWLLMQMGGGELNQQARTRWHDYMVNHFNFGKVTGIEQGFEAKGYVPNPNKGYGLNLTYANTAFGQAMTATPLQMAAALSSVVNGGTYYQPRLVDKMIDAKGKSTNKKPVVIKKNVVSGQVSKDIRSLMENVVNNRSFRSSFGAGYSIGGKTGTAQIANPAGGYHGDKYNGTYMGFVGGDSPQYVVTVRVNEPGIGGYAGSGAAQPIFVDLAHMLVDNFGVTPKSL